ncbi:PhzF family phenazine biosynthesis protein [Roseinatronobacter alkalisoli]|uniref:PhzF family phenazine biosynthesis protein n=1 Tax=Roseinatronobacter alkalisoli TaxID=3028235 RepID=A0ABT5TEN9_9RHOB|nr:PhzF family phenazine biosynthesis protein [Roseinatronobacter sp. HJB301]MDD7973575.1 PhzF family phenazine biosynthesis protein [Roseinatronobacter sp. HJB301]
MTMPRRFIQCDVFSATPTKGNALAVVVDGNGLSDEAMQRFARWTNLAETTFLMKPDVAGADYKVRIFTPAREMPFAGHPTLGSCMAWLEAGGTPRNAKLVRQQCEVGIIEIDLSTGTPAFAAPPTKVSPMEPAENKRIREQLGLRQDQIINTVELDNGPIWQLFELRSAAEVLEVDSSKVKWPEFRAIGLLGKASDSPGIDYEVRMLAPSSGMSEDPITGSLNAAIAKWLLSIDRLNEDIVVAQGRCIERDGRVTIRADKDGTIWIGGDVHMVVEGEVRL